MPYVLTLDGQPCRTGLQQLQASDLSELSLQDLPKLTDLEAAMRRVTPGKAVGDDDVPPEVHGDLMDKTVRQFWIRAACSGWVVGLLGPCETWSRARYHAWEAAGPGR